MLSFMQVYASFVSSKEKTRNEKLPHQMDNYFLPLTMRNTKEEIFNRVLPFCSLFLSCYHYDLARLLGLVFFTAVLSIPAQWVKVTDGYHQQ